MIAFDQVVSPLSVDVPIAVEVGIISMIDLSDHTPVSVACVCADRHRSVEPHMILCCERLWQPWHLAWPSDESRLFDRWHLSPARGNATCRRRGCRSRPRANRHWRGSDAVRYASSDLVRTSGPSDRPSIDLLSRSARPPDQRYSGRTTDSAGTNGPREG